MSYECCSPAVVIKDFNQMNHKGNPLTKYFGNHQWLERHTLEDALDWENNHESQIAILVGCGKCTWCRMKKTYKWANRLMLESNYHNMNDDPRENDVWFLTLTYEKVPKVDKVEYEGEIYINETGQGMLEPKDLELFWKRLRKNLEIEGLKYFACGEYGNDPKYTQRPHYHAIVYGLKIPDIKNVIAKNGKMTPYYDSEILDNIWGKGWITLRPVTIKSCYYVASYTLKKKYGEKALKEYYMKTCKVVPEFQRQSKGLAKQFYLENKDIIYSNDEIVNEKANVKVKSLEYYDRLYEDENPDRLEEIKYSRQERAARAMRNRAAQSTLTLSEILKIQDEEQKRQATEHLEKKMIRKAAAGKENL